MSTQLARNETAWWREADAAHHLHPFTDTKSLAKEGGSRIITFVTQSLIGLIDWGMSMQETIDMPRALNRNWVTELEERRGLENEAQALEHMGHEVKVQKLNSGLHGIRRVDGRLEGGADKRREGVVINAGG